MTSGLSLEDVLVISGLFLLIVSIIRTGFLLVQGWERSGEEEMRTTPASRSELIKSLIGRNLLFWLMVSFLLCLVPQFFYDFVRFNENTLKEGGISGSTLLLNLSTRIYVAGINLDILFYSLGLILISVPMQRYRTFLIISIPILVITLRVTSLYIFQEFLMKQCPDWFVYRIYYEGITSSGTPYKTVYTESPHGLIVITVTGAFLALYAWRSFLRRADRDY